MALKDDCIKLLTTDTAILKINFRFDGYLVFPESYHRDVAAALNRNALKVVETTKLNAGAGATYKPDYKEFWVPPGFSLANDRDASLLVHESTHAHMDYRRVGIIPLERSEAIGYLAEAVYREARSLPPIPGEGQFMRTKCHAVAKRIVAGSYDVPADQVKQLLETVKNEPHYIKLAASQGPDMNYRGL